MRFAIQLAILSGLTGTSMAQTCPLEDGFEPNDTEPTAAVLVAPGTIADLALLFDDPDCFSYVVAPSTEVTFTADLDSTLGPMALRLTDPGGTLVLDFDGGFVNSLEVAFVNITPAPVTVVACVFDFYVQGETCNEYDLTLTETFVVDPCSLAPDDSLEENDDCASAVPLGAGTVSGLFASTVDPDFFEITVPPGMDAIVTLDYDPAQVWFSLSSTAPCGIAFGTSGGPSGVAAQSYTNPSQSSEAFQVSVQANSNGPALCGSYDITVLFQPSACLAGEDPFEENDSCPSGVPLPLGVTSGLLLASGDQDWFEITVPPDGTLIIRMESTLPSGFLSLRIMETCDINTTLAEDAGTGPAMVTATNAGPMEVTWFVRTWSVSSFSNALCSLVELEVELQRNGAGWVENLCGAGAGPTGCAICPCGNDPVDPDPIRGCTNSSGTAATLFASGGAFVQTDSLRFEARAASPSTFAVLVSGDNSLPQTGPCPVGSGLTSPLLDGLRCAGGALIRHGARGTDALGDVGRTTPGWGGDDGPASGLLLQGAFSAGANRTFQVIYRDLDTAGCTTGQNTSNAVRVTFGL